MSEKKDWHAQGQHDQEKSRSDGWHEIISSGGSSPSYNPPGNSENKESYKSGWDNSKKN